MADQIQDSLLREIDEELRQERYVKLWKEYGKYVIAVAVLIVACVSGYKGWQTWEQQSRMKQSNQFIAAEQLVAKGDLEGARAAFAKLGKDGGAGYSALARLQAAGVLEKSGDAKAAAQAFQAVADDTSVPQALRDAAAIRAAWLQIDSADPTELTARVKPLTDANNPWHFSALEITGLLAMRTGDVAGARKVFTELMNDQEAPQSIRARASELLATLG